MEGTVFSISPNRTFGLIDQEGKLISFMMEDIADEDNRASLEIGDKVNFTIRNNGYREVAINVTVEKGFFNIFL